MRRGSQRESEAQKSREDRFFAVMSSRQVCLAKCTADRAEYFVELRQLGHLVSQTAGPECFQPHLFLKNGILKAFARFAAKFEFLADCVDQMIQFDTLVGRQVPKIVEVSRLIPRPVG